MKCECVPTTQRAMAMKQTLLPVRHWKMVIALGGLIRIFILLSVILAISPLESNLLSTHKIHFVLSVAFLKTNF